MERFSLKSGKEVVVGKSYWVVSLSCQDEVNCGEVVICDEKFLLSKDVYVKRVFIENLVLFGFLFEDGHFEHDNSYFGDSVALFDNELEALRFRSQQVFI